MKLSEAVAQMAARADDPDVDGVFLVFRRDDRVTSAVIHCPIALADLCQETILLATDAHHAPAGGVH